METEIWKDIENFEGRYQISNLGRVKSLPRIVKRNNWSNQTINEKILKTFINKGGYEIAVVQNGSRGKHLAIHRLVALAFIPQIEGKTFVNHIDGVKTNNAISNLEWCTRSENEKHAYRIGLKTLKGEQHSQNILNETQVLQIRALRGKYSGRKVAKMYNMSHAAIFAIWLNRSWTHL
jgi:hypothetical protein